VSKAEKLPKPGNWSVPREWVGERCFIIAGGPSIKQQLDMIPRLKGRIIAIKQAVSLRPDADVMFVAGKDDPEICRPYFPLFKGRYLVTRTRAPGFPPEMLVLGRSGAHKNDPKKVQRLSHDPRLLAGWDAGASAINLAFLFGSPEIVCLGIDMTGNRWVKGPHPLPVIPRSHHEIHSRGHAEIAADLKAARVRVVNVSPTSTLDCYERGSLEDFL
jgi:hypothetical protein